MIDTPALQADIAGSKFQFLILGVGRSGTSLLAGLLDSHSQLEIGFERYGDECLRGKDLPENKKTMFFDRVSSFFDRCIEEANHSEKAIWGNKITSEQLAGLNKHNLFNTPAIDVLDTFFNSLVPSLKVIYLLRDGRSCVASKLKRTPQSLEQACKSWILGVETYHFLQSRPNTLFLRYEDLLQDPVNVLTQACSFIGVEFESCMLGGTMNEKMLGTYRRNGIDSVKAKIVDTNHPCVPLIEAELRSCGYID